MELDTVALLLKAFYRLVGTDPDDPALTDLGEAEDDVAYVALTRGIRAAQRYLLDFGYGGWRKRSAALSWSGSDDADGGRYLALPEDFLRAFGRERESPLREASGRRWGRLVEDTEDSLQGNYFYFRGSEELWLARKAAPPTTLYLEYHYKHPEMAAGVTVDFPVDAASLIVAEAADAAMAENWFPLDDGGKASIARALTRARTEARSIARPTKAPRRLRKPLQYGNRW